MKRRTALSSTLFIVLSAFSLLLMLVATLLTYGTSHTSTELLVDEVRKRLEATAVAASHLVPYERLEEIQVKEDAYSVRGEELRSELIEFADQMNLLFVYYLRLMPDGSEEFVIDNDTDPATATYPGVKRVSTYSSLAAAAGQVTSTELSEVESFDFEEYTEYFVVTEEIDDISFISSYAPIYDEMGNVAYLAGVDGLRYNLHAQEQHMAILTSVHIATLIATCLFAGISVAMFRRRARLSEEASRAKSQFLSSMSHEIRTPLNTIMGMTDIALRGGSAEKTEYLNRIHYASNHLLMVVNDILDMSKIQENKFTISPTDFSYDTMMGALQDAFHSTMTKKGLTFLYEKDPSIPSYLYGDNQRLAQVLLNLLSNAEKFTPRGGTVELKAKLVTRDGNHLRLGFSIRDTGIGISPEDQERIFKPFEQADKSTTRLYGGTGLGLAISQTIVKAMGGTLELTSEPNVGSVFFFEVNMEAGTDRTEMTTAENTPAGEVDFADKTILIVDDMEINRDIVTAMLEETGATLLEAEDGQQAVEIFKSNEQINVILMDVQMPRMDGLTATRTIRALGSPRALAVPIIAMTANAMREDAEACLTAGMNSHIGKPIDWDTLLQRLRNALEKQK
jgi:signal transduction histidine kinase/ActR/RegA family two-component response regulator